MNNIQIEWLKNDVNQILLKDLQYIQNNFNKLLKNSEKTIIENSIKETRFLIEQVEDNSKTNTYYDKHLIFNQINKVWFDLYKNYQNSVEAIDLIKTIDHLTNGSIAYSRMFLSLSLINENRTDKYKDDLQKIVSGFLLLCETIDVFIDLFSISELEQINYGAENAILISDRNIVEYFEEDIEVSNIVTQLRLYSSLIILRLKEYINKTNLNKEKCFDLELKLKEMANDSEIQSEITSIDREFLVTEMDGLT